MMDTVKILLGGSGGQGILTFGKLISFASIRKNYYVSCLPTYGAEMRGGYIYNFVIISKKDGIFSPISENCDIGVFLNEMSYKMLKKYLKRDAYFLLNSSLIKAKKERKKIEIPATEIAERIGDIRIANMVMAGALSKLINDKFLDFKIENLMGEIEKLISDEKTKKLCETALKEGWNYIKI